MRRNKKPAGPRRKKDFFFKKEAKNFLCPLSRRWVNLRRLAQTLTTRRF
jgi:hypothetical protein